MTVSQVPHYQSQQLSVRLLVPKNDIEEHTKMCPLIQCEYHMVGSDHDDTMTHKDQKVHNTEKMTDHSSSIK